MVANVAINVTFPYSHSFANDFSKVPNKSGLFLYILYLDVFLGIALVDGKLVNIA